MGIMFNREFSRSAPHAHTHYFLFVLPCLTSPTLFHITSYCIASHRIASHPTSDLIISTMPVKFSALILWCISVSFLFHTIRPDYISNLNGSVRFVSQSVEHLITVCSVHHRHHHRHRHSLTCLDYLER